MKNYSFGLVGYQALFNNCSELKVQNKTVLYIDKMYWRWSSWWVRLLGAITDVPGDIMCGSHHKSFFYTAEVVAMAVNNSPFLTRLTRAISFNVLLTRLLGSNKTNSNFFFSRFGAKLWNEIPCNIRHLPKNKFKKTLRKLLFDILNSEDDYIDTPTLIKKVKLAKNVEK